MVRAGEGIPKPGLRLIACRRNRKLGYRAIAMYPASLLNPLQTRRKSNKNDHGAATVWE
jgi:hypothetical protein